MGTVISSNNMRSPNIMQIILDREGTISNVTPRFKARMPADDRQQRLSEMRTTLNPGESKRHWEKKQWSRTREFWEDRGAHSQEWARIYWTWGELEHFSMSKAVSWKKNSVEGPGRLRHWRERHSLPRPMVKGRKVRMDSKIITQTSSLGSSKQGEPGEQGRQGFRQEIIVRCGWAAANL